MRIIAFLAALLVCTPASACIRSTIAFDFSDQVNNELSYLICLHNEQNERINEQSRRINEQTDLIESLSRKLVGQELDLHQLRLELNTIRSSDSDGSNSPSSHSLPAIKRTAEEEAEMRRVMDEIRRIVEQQTKPIDLQKK